MTEMKKIDLFKELKQQDYKASKNPAFITTRKDQYLSIEGKGAPGGEEFTRKIGALYAMAYTVKMTRKFGGKQDYVIGKLEAQWWGKNGDDNFFLLPPEQWNWKMLMRTPECVGKDELENASATLLEKGKEPEVKEVRLEPLHEGKCIQMLHIGPYDRENETIEQMKEFAGSRGYSFNGLHHEIYLSDPRRVPPERLKTILRIPVIKHT
jgi:hypothetical protein